MWSSVTLSHGAEHGIATLQNCNPKCRSRENKAHLTLWRVWRTGSDQNFAAVTAFHKWLGYIPPKLGLVPRPPLLNASGFKLWNTKKSLQNFAGDPWISTASRKVGILEIVQYCDGNSGNTKTHRMSGNTRQCLSLNGSSWHRKWTAIYTDQTDTWLNTNIHRIMLSSFCA